MSDPGPCNCEQALELADVLASVISCAEDGCFGELFESCEDNCLCVICAARKVLKKWGTTASCTSHQSTGER